MEINEQPNEPVTEPDPVDPINETEEPIENSETVEPDPVEPEIPWQAFSDNLNLILEGQASQTEIIIVFGNIFFGLLLGYMMVKGMTKPWR
ncbi:hypothetical protein [Paenibacillus sp. 453mf]|uniref:hypothetical protein n=1 Tax=Paenibacillus sp. 453mf TaxID=1761874 RepID=UPI0008ECCB95|nr:hypothetical protein [Paenibacillus sp. 453mf]SFT00900.1 hypothetical protein SAMN04488601_1219 [Paenibacillus sp. 453mf]